MQTAAAKIVNRAAEAPKVRSAASAIMRSARPKQEQEQVQAQAPKGAQRSAMKVSSPRDPAEKEAEGTAKKIMRMALPGPELAQPVIARMHDAHALARRVMRKATGKGKAEPDVAAEIARAQSGGEPLPMSVRKFMEPRFAASFANVRIHRGETAAKLSRKLSAQAFTVAGHIFFGRDKFQPDSSEGKELIAHELTHTIQQGAAAQLPAASKRAKNPERAKVALPKRAPLPKAPPPAPARANPSPVTTTRTAAPQIARSAETPVISQSSAPHVQRLGISDALDYFADKANMIPGFRMFTIVLGVNPVNMSSVARTPANVMRAAVEFMPGGGLITQALDNHGIFDKVGNWVSEQIAALGLVGASIKQAITKFLDSLSWKDILSLGKVWSDAKAILTEPIEMLIGFIKGLVIGILEMIRDAILKPIAALAQGTPAYDLLCAVIGKDPVTGDKVASDGDAVIGGFMKLAGQQEAYNNMKKANAGARVWAWFQGAMKALMGFVSQIPTLFLTLFKSLQIMDLVIVPRAFAKIVSVFGSFAGSFISWAGNAVWNLLEIVFEVVSPNALAYAKKTGAALKSILMNPMPFVGNLVAAAKAGFSGFASRFGTHLKSALINWLTGSMKGVYIPKGFTIVEILRFVLSVLGLSWGNIRPKLVKILGATAVGLLEKAAGVVKTLKDSGPSAAWAEIKQHIADLQGMVVSGIVDLVTGLIVTKAIPKLIAMFIPGAGFIAAIVSIYDTVMVFVNKVSEIAAVVTGFINSITAIAAGQIGAAAQRVEGVLAGGLTLAINFFMGFAGLGKVADRVMGFINSKIRAPIDKAIDKALAAIAKTVKKLLDSLLSKVKAAVKSLFSWGGVKSTFSDDDGGHTIHFKEGGKRTLMIASTPIPAATFLAKYLAKKKKDDPKFEADNAAKIAAVNAAISASQAVADKIEPIEKKKKDDPKLPALQQELLGKNVALSGALAALIDSDTTFKNMQEKYLLEGLTGTYGSMPKPKGDGFTADHQPQAAVLIAAAALSYFEADGTLAKQAAGRAKNGYAINLHQVRHMAGRTYGGKGGRTKGEFQAAVDKAAKARKTPAGQRAAVVALIKADLAKDVAAMTGACAPGSANWTDLKGIKAAQRKTLISEISGRISAGGSQMANQDVDSLVG